MFDLAKLFDDLEREFAGQGWAWPPSSDHEASVLADHFDERGMPAAAALLRRHWVQSPTLAQALAQFKSARKHLVLAYRAWLRTAEATVREKVAAGELPPEEDRSEDGGLADDWLEAVVNDVSESLDPYAVAEAFVGLCSPERLAVQVDLESVSSVVWRTYSADLRARLTDLVPSQPPPHLDPAEVTRSARENEDHFPELGHDLRPIPVELQNTGVGREDDPLWAAGLDCDAPDTEFALHVRASASHMAEQLGELAYLHDHVLTTDLAAEDWEDGSEDAMVAGSHHSRWEATEHWDRFYAPRLERIAEASITPASQFDANPTAFRHALGSLEAAFWYAWELAADFGDAIASQRAYRETAAKVALERTTEVRAGVLRALGDRYECGPNEDWIKKGVYKYTNCGAWIEFTDTGVRLGSIVEGSDASVGPVDVAYNGNDADFLRDFDLATESVEAEADVLWREVNLPQPVPFDPEGT